MKGMNELRKAPKTYTNEITKSSMNNRIKINVHQTNNVPYNNKENYGNKNPPYVNNFLSKNNKNLKQIVDDGKNKYSKLADKKNNYSNNYNINNNSLINNQYTQKTIENNSISINNKLKASQNNRKNYEKEKYNYYKINTQSKSGNDQKTYNVDNHTKNYRNNSSVSKKIENNNKREKDRNKNISYIKDKKNVAFNKNLNININNTSKEVDNNKNYLMPKSKLQMANNQNNSNCINRGHAFNYNRNVISNNSQENKMKEKDKERELLIEQEKINEIFPESYFCSQCLENLKIKLNSEFLSVSTKCKNGHKINNIPIKEFLKNQELIKKNNFKCSTCKKNYEEKLLFFCSCNYIICKDCKRKSHYNHSNIPFIQKNYICLSHKKSFVSFCQKCKKNICNDCFNEHIKHKESIIYYKQIIPKEKDIKECKKRIERIKMYKEKFNKDMDDFFEKLKEKKNEFIINCDNFIQLENDIINNLNTKETLNYENICNMNDLDLNKNIFKDYLELGNNFNKQGKFLLNLFSPEDIDIHNQEKKDIENKTNKIVKEYKISRENNINIFGEENIKETRNFNLICENINNIYINNFVGNNINKENNNINQLLNEIKNIDKKNIKEKKPEEVKNIQKKFEVIQKIENCEKNLENKDERCITSFFILKNNRIVFTFKGGIIKFYEFEKSNNTINLRELLRLEEDEYCFNYGIELQDSNVAVCSEDGTVKIIQLFFDEITYESKEKYKIIQIIDEINKDPIYIIKELQNKSLVLGCWKNILVYQKAAEYELVNKIKINDYTFSILEISPNEIVASHSESKTLTGHNFKKNKYYLIRNIESNENNNIICKYNNKRKIIFVGFDKGISIVSIARKCLIKKIILNEIISSICPIEMKVNINGKDKNIFGILMGAKRKIFGENVNFAYSMLQLGFNLNDKDEGIISDDDNKEINYAIISRKDRIHYYDVNNLQNSLWMKNKETLNIIQNKNEQWIFSSGNEDKLIKIWNFK